MSGKMTKFKDLLVDTPNRYTVNGEVKTIVFAPNTITQEGTKDKAEYFNEMQKNSLYNVNATRVVEGTVEFYDIAIDGSDTFDVFDTQFIINFNETNTKLNPVLRFNNNNYYIRALEGFIDIDVQIGSLQKTYIGFLDSTNNKLKLMNYERKLIFDTVVLAQAYSGFVVGDIVETLGYTTKGDGNGRKYIVKATDDGTNLPYGTGLWFNKFSDVNLEKGGYEGTAQDFDTALKNEKIKLLAVSDDGHFSYSGQHYDYNKLNDDFIHLDGNYNGYLFRGDGADKTVEFRFKDAYGVVIGDSISQGSTASNSALYPSTNLSLKNVKGQYSYHLSKAFGIPFFNHGFAGQNTTNVRNRWNRDVLAQNVVGLSPTRTIPSDMGKAKFVFIHVGVNGIRDNTETRQQIKDNLLFFANSCKENGMICVMDTIGGWTYGGTPNQAQTDSILDINNYIKTELVKKDVIVNDYYSYVCVSTTENKPNMTDDGIHPYDYVYYALSKKVIDLCKNKPIFSKGIKLLCYASKQVVIAGTPVYTTPDIIYINGIETIAIKNNGVENELFYSNRDVLFNQYDTNTITIKGFNSSKYGGYARIEIELSKYSEQTQNIQTANIIDSEEILPYTLNSNWSNLTGFDPIKITRKNGLIRVVGNIKPNINFNNSKATLLTCNSLNISNVKLISAIFKNETNTSNATPILAFIDNATKELVIGVLTILSTGFVHIDASFYE